MASPTQAELEDQLQAAVDLIDGFWAGQTLPADLDALEQVLEGDFARALASAAGTFVDQVDAALEAANDIIGTWLVMFTHHVVQAPERTPAAALQRVYRYFADNNLSVKSRSFTYGTPTAGGSNVGDFVVKRLTVDAFGYSMENVHQDTKTLTCYADANTGTAPHEELFELRGGPAPRRKLSHIGGAIKGSGLTMRDPLLCMRNARTHGILQNGAFDAGSFATQPTAGSPYTLTSNDSLDGWTVSDITKVAVSVDSLWRNYGSSTGLTSKKLSITGNITLTQALSQNGTSRLDSNTPYYRGLMVRRVSSWDGTIAAQVGSKSMSVAGSSLTNDEWYVLEPSMDENLWPRNFNTTDAAATITITGRTTGAIEVQEFLVTPMIFFDGAYHVVRGGTTSGAASVKALLGDVQTWSDSVASDSKIQRTVWLTTGLYLPHRPNATQVTASGGRTLTFATSGDSITASSGSFITDGYHPGMLLTVAGSSSNNGTYTIVTVTATVITVAENLTDEGPLSSTATLNATPSIVDP